MSPRIAEAVLLDYLAMRLAFVAACAWVVLTFGTFSGNNFIYFQF